MLEPRESLDFDLCSLVEGGAGLRATRRWIALAPHLGCEIEVDAEECALLGRLPSHTWEPFASAATGADDAVLKRLVSKGLVLREDAPDDAARRRDDAVRALHWHVLSAVAHTFTRWRDIDSAEEMDRNGLRTLSDLVTKLGPPPPHFHERADATAAISLPAPESTPLSNLLAARSTCRNFDTTRVLSTQSFAEVMHRVFAAQAVVEATPGASIVKKFSPAGGGLHAVEAYVLVQRVAGIAPGLYHYHAGQHVLESLPIHSGPASELEALARRMLAGQYWFAPAHVLVILAPRFARSHWKYRNHSKAYRALLFDVGHLSQTLYLSATEQGLGAFVTAAINESEIEAAFALDALADGPVAICGFGLRAAQQVTMEFDPLGAVWPK